MKLSTQFAILLLNGFACAAQPEGFTPTEIELLRAAIQKQSRQELAPARSLSLGSTAKIDPALWPDPPGAERSLAAPANVDVEVRGATLQSVAQLQSAVAALGGSVLHTFDNILYVSLPPSRVAELAARPDVAYLQASQPRAVHQTLPLTADGLEAARVSAAHQSGLRGKGIRIGILDSGFGGYAKLLDAGRVKPPRAIRAFPPGHHGTTPSIHGTACAEIISAIAPDAELVLASYDGRDGNAMAAATWLIQQGVRIISLSMGGAHGPSDGSDELSRFIDRTTQQYGVQWIVSAGNSAQHHWSAIARDQDKDSLVDVNFQGLQGLYISPVSDSLTITVKWDDWGGNPRVPNSTQDIDAELYLVDQKSKQVSRVETRNQRQGPGVPPQERIPLAAKGLAGKRFLLLLRAVKLTRPVRLHVFLEPAGILLPNSPAGSLTNPATARSALSVGAIDVLTNALAPYSSQGPTDDNRLKPEISAPTNTTSFVYAADRGRFPGTSASCPHVAGIAALLLQANPGLKPAELKRDLIQAVRPLGEQVPNAQTGFGLIDASRVRARRNDPAATPTPREGTALTVPAAFGSSVSSAVLATLRQRAGTPRDGLEVRVTAGRELYELGDGMRLGMLASDSASCLLFQNDSVQGFTLAVPIAMQPFQLRPGAPLLLPADQESTLEVVEPAGPGELFLLCARRPQPIAQALDDPANWATAVFSYFVLPKKSR
jgi:subtilisin family serine protease